MSDFETRWRKSFEIEHLIDEEMKKNVEKKVEEVYSKALLRVSKENDKNLKHSMDDVHKILSVCSTVHKKTSEIGTKVSRFLDTRLS